MFLVCWNSAFVFLLSACPVLLLDKRNLFFLQIRNSDESLRFEKQLNFVCDLIRSASCIFSFAYFFLVRDKACWCDKLQTSRTCLLDYCSARLVPLKLLANTSSEYSEDIIVGFACNDFLPCSQSSLHAAHVIHRQCACFLVHVRRLM